MKKNLVLGLAILSILLLSFVTLNTSAAANYKNIGVHAGNSADYTVKMSGIANASTVHLAITGVSGTNVNVTLTGTYPNGTTASVTFSNVNVSIGKALPFIIPGNLAVGDRAFSGATIDFTIDDNKSRVIAGVNRTVNHVHDALYMMSVLLFSMDFYWDKASGLLGEQEYYVGGTWLNMTATSLSVGGGGGFLGLDTTTWLLIGGVAIIIIVGAALALRGRGKHK